jgi:glycosyltransferase involved in cell wall biosynthesis
MRIALITDKLSTGGGLEHIYQLCAGMPDLEFGVFGAPGNANNKFDRLANVNVFLSNDNETIKRFSPDLIHYHHLKPLARLSVPGGRKFFTVHGVHLHRYEFVRGLKSVLARAARLTLEKLVYRRMDRVIAVSAEDSVYLQRFHGCDSVVIYNGINFAPIEEINESKSALRRRLQLPDDKQLYLMVARFDFPKGHDVLIQAVSVLKQRGCAEGRLFVLAGDGDLLAPMKELADRLGVSEYFMFLGVRRDVYDLMHASDVFVLPSRWEGLPITLIEALVARLPAVASRTYGVATVARETGDNVRLFANEDPEDLADNLLNPPEFASCNLEMFKLQSMITATRKLYVED